MLMRASLRFKAEQNRAGGSVGWHLPAGVILVMCLLLATGPAQAQDLLGPEDFSSGVPPTGWIQVDVGGTSNVWTANTSRPSPGSGGNAAFFDDYNGANDVWLISSAIDASSVSTLSLAYWDNVNYATYVDVNEVYYSTDYAGSGDPGAATWTLVNSTAGTEDTWVENTFDISGAAGAASLYIAFRYAGDYASEWYIDDVRVFEPPTWAVTVIAVDSDSDHSRGVSVDYTFRVTNAGAGADTFDLAGSGAYFDSLSTSATAVLAPGASEDVTLTATVPCSATPGTTEGLQLTATSQGDGSVSDNASLDVTVVDTDAGGGGAAEGGYYFANSISACAASAPTFGWIDISTTGTEVTASLDDDNFIGPFSIGFSFTYFGASYTELYISSNGWITFDSTEPAAADSRNNTALPSAGAPNNLIAVFWDDMNPDDPDPGSTHVYYGAGPGGEMVVTFDRLPEYNSGASAEGWITTQVVLYPTGNIRVQNQDRGTTLDLLGATVGIENADGTLGVQYHLNGAGGVLFSSPLAIEYGQDVGSLPVELVAFEIK